MGKIMKIKKIFKLKLKLKIITKKYKFKQKKLLK